MSKKGKLDSLESIILFQIITHCFLKNIKLSDSEKSCLALLGVEGEIEISKFCVEAVKQEYFKTTQSVRNFVTKAEKLDLVSKIGTTKKCVKISDSVEIVSEGNIYFKTEFAYVAEK